MQEKIKDVEQAKTLKGNIELKIKRHAEKEIVKSAPIIGKLVAEDFARFRKDLSDEEEYDQEEAKVEQEKHTSYENMKI